MKKVVTIIMIMVFALAIGCSDMNTTEETALKGAGVGAAGGAIVGAVAGNAAVGAAVGAAAGAAAGAIYGDVKTKRREKEEQPAQ